MRINTRTKYRGFEIATYFDGAGWTGYATGRGEVHQGRASGTQDEAVSRLRAWVDAARAGKADVEPSESPGATPTGLALYEPPDKD
jgi:hypothetical protein